MVRPACRQGIRDPARDRDGATELSGEEVRRVRERVAGAAGDASNVLVTVRLDPEILGGLTIREGDQIFDYSVRTRLEVLRERMS